MEGSAVGPGLVDWCGAVWLGLLDGAGDIEPAFVKVTLVALVGGP